MKANTNAKDISYLWSAKEIRDRLGCSSIVFERDHLLRGEEIARLRESGITVSNSSRVMNTELASALRLQGMLALAEKIVSAED